MADNVEIIEKDGIRIAKPKGDAGLPMEQLLRRAGIPPSFADRSFDNFMVNSKYPSLFKAKKAVQRYAELYPAVEGGLLIMGPTGVGKTHLAVALCKELLKKGADCFFLDFRDSLKEYTSFSNQDKREDYLFYLAGVEVLIWDDFASRPISEWEEDFVYRLIDKRYREGRALILTTVHAEEPEKPQENEEETVPEKISLPRRKSTLEEIIGVRLRSRLYEMCTEIYINAPDYRSKVRRLSYRAGGGIAEEKSED